MLINFLKTPVFKAISNASEELNIPAYVIGGYVRDKLLGKDCKDIDIVAIGSGIELAHATAALLGNPKVSFFKNFGTAMFKYKDMDIEFVGARKESYQRNSRKPIVQVGTLQDDQNRRDFTINALALDLTKKNFGNLLDPFNGISDLEKKIIRTPLNPDITYSDDPLRMLRAIRFATQLNFTIEENSLKAIAKNAYRLEIVSQERISEELNKIIKAPIPSLGFKLLFETTLLQTVLPEMYALQGVDTVNGKSHKDNFYHTLEVLDNVSKNSNNIWLRWAAIMHDIAKPLTKKFDKNIGWTFHGHEDKGARMVKGIFTKLKLPLDHKMEYVQKLVRLHLRPISLVQEKVTDSAIRRLLFEAGNDIDDLMLLCNADITSKNEAKVKRYLKNFELVKQKLQEVEEKDHLRNFQPPITGEQIMKIFNLHPCKIVGEIKNSIKDAILEGEITNTYDDAYNYMINKAKEIGLQPKL